VKLEWRFLGSELRDDLCRGVIGWQTAGVKTDF
jgi:hypothetical protein